MLHRADGAGLLDDGVLFHPQQGAQLQLGAAVARPDAVGPLLHHPAGPLRVEGGQLLLGDVDGQGLFFAGGQQAGLGKAGQTPVFPRPAVLRAGQIELRRLPAGKADAVVPHRQGHVGAGGLHLQLFKGDLKAGVGQPVPKGEQRLHPKAVKVAVTHIDALGVDGLVQIAVQVAEAAGVGVILVAAGPGGGQLALGRSLAQQDVGHGVAPLLPQLGELEDRLDVAGLLQQAGQLDRAAGVQQQDDGQAQPVQGQQVCALGVAEVVVPFFQPAVLTLARDAADDVEGRGRLFQVLGGHRPALRQDEGVGRIGVEGVFDLFGVGQDLVLPGQPGGLVAGLVVGQPALAGDFGPRFPQALVNGDVGAVVHVPRANAAFDGPARAGPQQGDGGGRVERQDAGVFEQDDAGCRGPAGQARMGLFAGGGFLVQAAAVFVQMCHGLTSRSV